MTNEEIVEEILHEAEDLNIRKEVLTKALNLRKLFPTMSILESIESAFKSTKNEKLDSVSND